MSSFLIYRSKEISPEVIAIGIEFERSGKVVIENKDFSLTLYNSLDEFLTSNKDMFIKRVDS